MPQDDFGALVKKIGSAAADTNKSITSLLTYFILSRPY